MWTCVWILPITEISFRAKRENLDFRITESQSIRQTWLTTLTVGLIESSSAATWVVGWQSVYTSTIPTHGTFSRAFTAYVLGFEAIVKFFGALFHRILDASWIFTFIVGWSDFTPSELAESIWKLQIISGSEEFFDWFYIVGILATVWSRFPALLFRNMNLALFNVFGICGLLSSRRGSETARFSVKWLVSFAPSDIWMCDR
jgi:hypothetical protein